ncbi:MAG: hypothetical protein KA735_04960 [Burkholderiaceae bacterium]|nr:hypothetical protein [Burkholderiaceae bacterium]
MPCKVISKHRYGWGQPRFYGYVGTAAGLCLELALNAQAAYGPERRMQALDLPAVVWESAHIMQVATQPLHVRSFSSSQPPVQLAKALAGHSDIFQRVLTSKHKIVLSGLQPGWHWLAEINAVPGGTQGYVSALYVDGARLLASGSEKASGDVKAALPTLPFSRR